MKFDSPLFDRIRVKPEKDRRPKTGGPGCEWHGCKEKATHRAPKGRGREKDYWRFCLESRARIQPSVQFLRRHERRSGHGVSERCADRTSPDLENGNRQRRRRGRICALLATMPIHLDCSVRGCGRNSRRARKRVRFAMPNAKRSTRSVSTLTPPPQQVKTRFKELVKRHHPDANGGDRSTEDRLVEIIQSYNYLKSVGFG